MAGRQRHTGQHLAEGFLVLKILMSCCAVICCTRETFIPIGMPWTMARSHMSTTLRNKNLVGSRVLLPWWVVPCLSLWSKVWVRWRAWTALTSHQTIEARSGKEVQRSCSPPLALGQDELYLRHSWQILSKLFLKTCDGCFTPFLTIYSGISLSLPVFSLVSPSISPAEI